MPRLVVGQDPVGDLRDQLGTIGLRHQLAQHVIVGAPPAWVWAEDPTADVDVDRLTSAVNRAVARALEREVDEDVGFGLRQLVDIAVRAVSVSTNDRYTAVQAVQHLTVLLAELWRPCHRGRVALRG